MDNVECSNVEVEFMFDKLFNGRARKVKGLVHYTFNRINHPGLLRRVNDKSTEHKLKALGKSISYERKILFKALYGYKYAIHTGDDICLSETAIEFVSPDR